MPEGNQDILPQKSTFNQLRKVLKPIREQSKKDALDSGITPGTPQFRRVVRNTNRRVYYEQQRADEAEERTMTDPLTDLLNQHGMERSLNEALTMARREGTILVLGFADLNGLKAVNDTLGHAVGSKYIVDTANIFGTNNRPGDIVAHPHGDEFVFALPKTDLEGARKWLERKNEEFERRNIHIAVGITLVDPSGEDPIGTATKEADQTMYVSKKLSKETGQNVFLDYTQLAQNK